MKEFHYPFNHDDAGERGKKALYKKDRKECSGVSR